MHWQRQFKIINVFTSAFQHAVVVETAYELLVNTLTVKTFEVVWSVLCEFTDYCYLRIVEKISLRGK
jgi:ATP adenylyltransferase/5',5'''-P-1,P-4-tetraphosphate phosphorylase II